MKYTLEEITEHLCDKLNAGAMSELLPKDFEAKEDFDFVDEDEFYQALNNFAEVLYKTQK